VRERKEGNKKEKKEGKKTRRGPHEVYNKKRHLWN